MNKVSRISDFYHHVHNCSHVSFDLFDTLVRRRLLKVNEVHDTVSGYMIARVAALAGSSPMELTLLRYRMSDAMKSPHTTQEPFIGDVWDRIIRRHVPDDIERLALIGEGVDFEQQIELSNLALVPGAEQLLDRLKRDGKTIVAISDMYFHKQFVQNVLDILGISDFFTKLYVSTDERLTKQTGDLFRRVVADLGIAPRQMMHVGDNVHSDVRMAAAAGIRATLVEQPQLLTIERPQYGQRERIEEDVADLVKTHLFTLLLDARQRGADQLYFMARDGCAINAFLSRWQSPIIERFLSPPPAADLYLNRVLSCWGGIDFAGDWLGQVVDLAFWLNHEEVAPAALMALLGVQTVPAGLGHAVLRSKTDRTRVIAAIQRAGLADRIKTAVQGQRAELVRYLEDIGFFEHRSVIFSDVGYSGTVLRDLNNLFLHRAADESPIQPPAMTLHLLATNDQFARNRARAYPFVTFAGQPVLPAEQLPSDLKASFAWLEYFFKHRTLRPILRFVDGGGRLQPDTVHGPPVAERMPSDRLLDFAVAKDEDIVLLWMATVNFAGQLTLPIIERFNNPDAALLEQMSDPVFEQHSLQGTYRSILLRRPGARKDAITIAAAQGDYWIAGSILASEDEATSNRSPDVTAPRAASRGLLDRLVRRRRSLRPEVIEPLPGATFDPSFYGTFYTDLRHLQSDAELTAHYVNHGRGENRLPTRDALHVQLEAEFGPLPDAFDGDAYLLHNPDLAREIVSSDQALDHFMRFGRNEGRVYRHAGHPLTVAFERLANRGTIVLSETEHALRAGGTPTFMLFLQRHGVRAGRWIDDIDVAEFRALHQAWCGEVEDVAACIVAVLEHGLARTPSLSLRAPFDPDYYRRQAPELAELSDVDLYRHYLNQGSERTLATAELVDLRRIWGRAEFPQALDVEAYREANLPLKGASRAAVLSAFLDDPHLERLRFVRGSGAAQFLELVAIRSWRVHGRVDDARKLFRAAIKAGGPAGRIHHLLGDTYLQAGDRANALTHLMESVQSAAPDRWSYLHAANLLVEGGDHHTALAVLTSGEALWQSRAPWRRAYVRAMTARVDAVLDAMAGSSDRADQLDLLDGIMHEIEARLPDPFSAMPNSDDAVLLLTSHALRPSAAEPSGSRFRLRPVVVGEDGDPLDEILASDTVILHDGACSYTSLRTIALARRLNRRTVAWFGKITEWRGHSLARGAWADRDDDAAGLEENSFVRCAPLARYCDEVVTTLGGCRPLLERLAPGKSIEVLGMDSGTPRGASRDLRVVLVRQSSRLDGDSLEGVAHAIRVAASEDRTLHFLIDGELAEQAGMVEAIERWSIAPADASLSRLAALTATSDVVLLIGDGRQDYQISAEAMAHGVPVVTIAATSNVSDERDVGDPVGTVRLDEMDVADAFAKLRTISTIPVTAALPLPSAPGETTPQAALAAPARKKVLFANVFFAPQQIGGATRVLTDNIDYLLDTQGNAFEAVVFTADEQNDRDGEWRLDAYRGIPVFRVSTPQEIHMDWRPVNARVGEQFEAVLRSVKPDLVHIHCLQRLSVTVAEACRAHGVPYIVTLHDAWWISDFPFLSDENGLPVSARADFFAQERLVDVGIAASTRRADRLRHALLGAERRLAVSNSFAAIYDACGIPCDTIENGISRIDVVARRTIGERVRLCHIGGLQHHKGAYLVEIALRAGGYANLHLTIVDLAREPGDETNTFWGTTPVTIVGRMSTQQLAEFYAHTNILLAPSTWSESYGLVTREALAHGLWVIASDRGAIGEPVREGVNGFVVPVDDATGIAAALAKVDGDPATYRLSPPARELRTVDQQSAELVELYRALLRDAPADAATGGSALPGTGVGPLV